MKLQILNEQNGEKLRDILGVCNTPKKLSPAVRETNKALFDRLDFRYIRHHDASLGNPAHELVDVSRIFPFFHLDENDERNYRFNETDDYFEIVKDSKAEWEIRLGETIDHSGFASRIKMPPDAEKWARIGLNIVKHYIQKGYNITSVTVWEEPENPPLFSGTTEDYYALFSAVYKLFKKELPSVRIGGPTCGSHDVEYFKDFIALCVKNDTKPDFISQTIYPLTINVLLNAINVNRQVLIDAGYNDVPYVLSEWHYGGPGSFVWKVKIGRREKGNFDKTECASFTASALMKMHDIPLLERVYYYCWDIGVWSPYLIPQNEETGEYYALYYYQRLIHETEKRVNVTVDSENGVAMAGEAADGKTYILLSMQNQLVTNVTISGSDKKSCSVYAVKEEFSKTEAETPCLLTKNESGEFTFEHYTGNAVYFMILE